MNSHSDLPEKATGVLELFASTQTQIDVFSDQVIASVKDGEVSPLKVLIQLKAFERCSERIQKEIKDNYMNEADKYPGVEFEFLGNQIVKTDTKVEYDYSGCGDPQWEWLNQSLLSTKNDLKKRETFLKALTAPITVVDEVSGEMVTIYPPKITRVPGLKIFIK